MEYYQSSIPPSEATRNDVAIIGMGGMWANTRNWREAADAFFHLRDRTAANEAGGDDVQRGRLKPIEVSVRDFGCPPSMLASVEPWHWMASHVAEETLRDAGHPERSIHGERAALFLGISGGPGARTRDYLLRDALETEGALASPQAPPWTEDTLAGMLPNVAVGRIARRLDWRGACLAVDAACASSLAAVWMGWRELLCDACDLVLVGGVDAFQTSFQYRCFRQAGLISAKGASRPLDEEADGACLSEGIGMVVLKRWEDARRDGDRIYAVLKGVGSSSNGARSGVSAASAEGLLQAYRQAYAMADVSPATIGLVETHGLGVPAAERAEAESLRELFETAQAMPRSIAVGSAKSCLGYSKSAAGIAGLIKASWALYHRVLPGTAGVQAPAPAYREGPLYVNTRTRPWWSSAPRRAAVTAFGFGGTNWHAVLEEPDAPATEPPATRPVELYLWRGEHAECLLSDLRATQKALDSGARPDPAALARALWQKSKTTVGRTGAIVASSIDDLAAKIQRAIKALEQSGGIEEDGLYFPASPRKGRVAFLFAGQGSPYPGMFEELALHMPEFRTAIEEADRAMPSGQTLTSYLFPPPTCDPALAAEAARALSDTRIAQPALGAVELGICRVLSAFGIRPDMVAGHSYGEYPALCVAGAIAESDLPIVSEARGCCMAESKQRGGMIAASASADALREVIQDLDRVWIANLNSPSQTVLSGSPDALDEATRRLETADIAVHAVPVSQAFHSPFMKEAADRFGETWRTLPIASPHIPVYSNTTAIEHSDDPEVIRATLVDHLTSPVRFVEELENMNQAGARIFIEVGPKRILTSFAREILKNSGAVFIATDHPNTSSVQSFLSAVGRMAAHGVYVNLDSLWTGVPPTPDVDTLLEASQPQPFTEDVWLVDSASARPAHCFNPPMEEPTMTSPLMPLNDSSSPVPETGFEDDAWTAHCRLMDRFLQTHRSVMEAYFKGNIESGDETDTFTHSSDPELSDPTPAPKPEPSEQTVEEPPAAAEPTPAREALLDITAAKTGYPLEMLDLDARMEADLGIDSIKRVEIIGAMRKQYAALKEHAGDEERKRLAAVKTLRDILQWAESRLESVGPAASEECSTATATADGMEKDPPADLARYLLKWMPAPACGPAPAPPRGATVLITDEGGELTRALCAELERGGCRPLRLMPGHTVETIEPGQWTADFHNAASIREAVDRMHGSGHRIDGIIHALPMSINSNPLEVNAEDWSCAMALTVKSCFYLAQALESDLRGDSPEKSAFFTTLSPWHATFEQAANGGLEGFLNTVCLEWPNVICKAIEIPPAMDAEIAAKHIMDEMPRDDGAVPVVRTENQRLIRGIAQRPIESIAPNEPLFSPDDVILITGGARGITAQVAKAVARHGKPHIVLAGRSPLPSDDEPDDTRTLTDPAALRRALAARLRAQGAEPVLRDVETAYRSLCAAREIRETLESIQSAGSPVTYIPCDVRDAEAFEQMIEHVRETWGRLDGLIHGAGCIEDKKIEEKSPDAFDRVFDTKADSGRAIVQACNGASPRFIVLYSSIAMCGNIGQSDYAAANGVLDRLALYMNTIWPHTRTTALLWGPWRAGMVTDELARQFEERGVQVIPPDLGVQAFLCEIRRGGKSDVEVVLGDGPWRDGQASTRETTDPCADIYSDERTAITTAT